MERSRSHDRSLPAQRDKDERPHSTTQTLMNRLQKKCFIVSAGVHLLLFVILLVGPAFLSSKSHSEDVQALDFYPSKLIDAALIGGGNRSAKPPPTMQPAPQPPVQAHQQPSPVK